MYEKFRLCTEKRFINHGSLRIDDISYERESCPDLNVSYSATMGAISNGGFVEAEKVIGGE